MKVYIINLDSRKDRWLSATQQFNSLNLEAIRISAQDSTLLQNNENPFLADGVFAIWRSHQQALSRFLETDASHCMILEDDFILTKKYTSNRIAKFYESEFDLIQIGFLKFGFLDRFDVLVKNATDLIYKFLHKMSKYLPSLNLDSRLFISSQRGIDAGLVLANIRPGAHAYIVSRKMAEALLEINSPAFLSTDLLYMALGQMRSFKMVRTRRSIVGQSKSKSSIENRFRT